MFENFNLENDFDIKSLEKDLEQSKKLYESQDDGIILEQEDDWFNDLSKEELEKAKSLIEDVNEQMKKEDFFEGMSEEEINENIFGDENKVR